MVKKENLLFFCAAEKHEESAENMHTTQRPSGYTAERAALSRNVRHPAHRSWKGWDRPRLPWQDLPRATL